MREHAVTVQEYEQAKASLAQSDLFTQLAVRVMLNFIEQGLDRATQVKKSNEAEATRIIQAQANYIRQLEERLALKVEDRT